MANKKSVKTNFMIVRQFFYFKGIDFIRLVYYCSNCSRKFITLFYFSMCIHSRL